MNSIKINIILFVLAFYSNYGQARFSIGGDWSNPINQYDQIKGGSVGGFIRYEDKFKGRVRWTATIGYSHFVWKTDLPGSVFNPNRKNTADLLLINMGLKYYLNRSFSGLYIGGEIGTESINTRLYGYQYENQRIQIDLEPYLGYTFWNIDMSARVHVGTNTIDLLYGFRLGYILKLKPPVQL